MNKFKGSERQSFVMQYCGLVVTCTAVYFFAVWSGATNHSGGWPRTWGDPMPLRDAIAQLPKALAINAVILAAVSVGAMLYTKIKG